MKIKIQHFYDDQGNWPVPGGAQDEMEHEVLSFDEEKEECTCSCGFVHPFTRQDHVVDFYHHVHYCKNGEKQKEVILFNSYHEISYPYHNNDFYSLLWDAYSPAFGKTKEEDTRAHRPGPSKEYNGVGEKGHAFTIILKNNEVPIKGRVQCSCGQIHDICPEGVHIETGYQSTNLGGDFYPKTYLDLRTGKVSQVRE